jgi:hypothetical protein
MPRTSSGRCRSRTLGSRRVLGRRICRCDFDRHHHVMHFLLDDDHLAPEDVAALWVLGLVTPERIPWWAAQWLVQGHDGDNLRELAGEHGDDLVQIEELLPAALAEAGVRVPDDVVDAADWVFTYLARRCIEGRLSEPAVAGLVDQVLVSGGFEVPIYDLPLGRIYGVDDEWSGGWGRAEEALRDEVQRACRAQLSR